MDRAFTSAQIEQFKRDAKKLKIRRSISLHEALDEVARAAGYQRWHQLASARKLDLRCSFETMVAEHAMAALDALFASSRMPRGGNAKSAFDARLTTYYMPQEGNGERAFDCLLTSHSWKPVPLTPIAGCLYCQQCSVFLPVAHFFDNASHVAMDEAHLMAFITTLDSIADLRLKEAGLRAVDALGRFWEGLEALEAHPEEG